MVNATGRIFLEDLNVTTRCLSEYIRGNRYLPYFSSEKKMRPIIRGAFSNPPTPLELPGLNPNHPAGIQHPLSLLFHLY